MAANPYNPVTTTDTTHLADDDWGLNLPSIRYKSYDSSRFKGICNLVKERVRFILVIGCVMVLAAVLIAIIAVATHQSSGRKPTDKDREEPWASPEEGLVFYPIPKDGSRVISFAVDDPVNSSLFQSLDNATQAYDMTHQLQDPPYMKCTENTHRSDRVCQFGNHRFGTACTKHKGWGYPHAAPCILLQLNLPENVTIRPMTKDSLMWPASDAIMKNNYQNNDTSSVPVLCQGTTHKDRLILGLHGFDKLDPSPIEYFPPEGFPSYFYRPRNMSLPFLKPAIMIYLTSLKSNMMVHITCTAWGQLFDGDGNKMDHPLLQTHFAVYVIPAH